MLSEMSNDLKKVILAGHGRRRRHGRKIRGYGQRPGE